MPSCHPVILQPQATFCCLIKVFVYLTFRMLANLSIIIVSSPCYSYCSNPFQLSLSLPKTRFDFTWNLAYVTISLKFRIIECWTMKELQSCRQVFSYFNMHKNLRGIWELDSYFCIKNDIGTTMYILDNTNGSDQLFLEYKLGCNDSQMLSFCRQKNRDYVT